MTSKEIVRNLQKRPMCVEKEDRNPLAEKRKSPAERVGTPLLDKKNPNL